MSSSLWGYWVSALLPLLLYPGALLRARPMLLCRSTSLDVWDLRILNVEGNYGKCLIVFNVEV